MSDLPFFTTWCYLLLYFISFTGLLTVSTAFMQIIWSKLNLNQCKPVSVRLSIKSKSWEILVREKHKHRLRQLMIPSCEHANECTVGKALHVQHVNSPRVCKYRYKHSSPPLREKQWVCESCNAEWLQGTCCAAWCYTLWCCCCIKKISHILLFTEAQNFHLTVMSCSFWMWVFSS